jgi:hypothetical protein
MDDFKDIAGYPNYKINRNGECVGSRGWILKPAKNENGYYRYRLYLNGESKKILVHRLVGLTFLPNPLGLATVNHKDENKANNCVQNLEWMTLVENGNRASKVVNAKCYCQYRNGWLVQYAIEGKIHWKCFKNEDDAQFYVSLLKAIYPRF